MTCGERKINVDEFDYEDNKDDYWCNLSVEECLNNDPDTKGELREAQIVVRGSDWFRLDNKTFVQWKGKSFYDVDKAKAGDQIIYSTIGRELKLFGLK